MEANTRSGLPLHENKVCLAPAGASRCALRGGDRTSTAGHARACSVVPDGWYWNAFDELQEQGHLDSESQRANMHDAVARLSADGRYFLRHAADE